MNPVDIRDLEGHLRQYLAAVQRGEEVVVVEEGKALARIVREPDSDAADREALEKLAARGLVELPTRERRRETPPPLKVPGKPLSEIIIEDRG